MVELAEDEMLNFGKVWASVFVSLSYCYTLSKFTHKGFSRLLAILPVVALFLALPVNLTSFHLGGMTSFFIAWLANFKLLLFAFGHGPLCSDSSLSFPRFLAISCFPIKIQHDPPPINTPKSQSKQNPDQKAQNKSYPPPQNTPKSQDERNPDQKTQNESYPSPKNTPKSQNERDPDQKTQNKSYPSRQKPGKSPWSYIIKAALLPLIIRVYVYSDYLHPKMIHVIYFFHCYFTLELILALVATLSKILLGIELEPQFNEPLLSTSLQDFWGKRWNIMVNRILRPTVYMPVLGFSTRVVGRKWAPFPAVIASFFVSGIMHELIFYYLGHLKPTFEVTWFFLLHAFSLCLEIIVKKSVGEKWRVPRWLSAPATVAFVVVTGIWLFLPPLLRAGLNSRPFQDYAALGAFLRSLRSALSDVSVN